MGLTCSLLGHEYGEPVEERDRDETDAEVVVTVRDVRTCERCGAEQVVSENTEVRSLAPSETTDGPDATDASADADEPTGGAAAGAGAADAGVGSGATTDAHDETFDPPSPEEDDAIILEDEPEEPVERQRGQWPEASDTRLDEQAAPADAAADADGDDAAVDPADKGSADQDAGDESSVESGDEDASADDGETDADGAAAADSPVDASSDDADAADEDPIDADADSAVGNHAVGDWPDPTVEDEGYSAEPSSGGPDVSFGGGLTPQSAENVDEDGPELAAGDATGIRSAPAREKSDEVNVDAEFICPNCEFTTDALGGSLREGDICPDCQRGYLAEQ